MKVIKPVDITYPGGSFSRSSIGTYWDASGYLQTAGTNVPRFNYNPYTKSFQGLMLEAQSTNLFTNSEFNTGIASGIGIISIGTMQNFISAATFGYNGTTDSYFYKETVLATQPYVISVFVEMQDGLSPSFGSAVAAASTNDFCFVLSGNVLNPTSYSIERISTSIYRVSAQGTSGATLLGDNGIVKYASNSSRVFTTSGWQIELGTKVTSYIPTTSSTVTRQADTVTGTNLIYTSALDPTNTFNSGTTYAISEVVRYQNKLYESLQSTNLNHFPDASPTWWLELGYDNLYAAFDNSVSTATTANSELTMCIKAGAIDSVALINMDSAIAEIAVVDPVDGVVYLNTAGLSGNEVYDWSQYFFYDPMIKRTQVIFSDIQKYANAIVTIRLKNGINDLSIGQIVLGNITTLGSTQYGVNAGIIDFSKKETDEFGNTTFVKRAFSKRLSAQIFLKNSDLNRVQNYLYNIRATPVVWVASDDPAFEEALIVLGFYRDFSTEIAYPANSLCSLEIEGLS